MSVYTTLYLGFVSPCIIMYSNKSTNQMHQSIIFIVFRLNTAQHVSGILMPIIRSLSTAVAASGLPFGTWWQQCCWSWSVRTNHDQQHSYHHVPNGKPEAATAVDKLLMMGMRIPETCWAVFKRQAINLRDWCIWLVDLFEYIYYINLVEVLYKVNQLQYTAWTGPEGSRRLRLPHFKTIGTGRW